MPALAGGTSASLTGAGVDSVSPEFGSPLGESDGALTPRLQASMDKIRVVIERVKAFVFIGLSL
jgi:hypothetical protein